MNAPVQPKAAKAQKPPMFPRPVGKKPTLAEVLEVLQPLCGEPVHLDRAEDPLLDHLLVAVLSLHTTPARARDALRALSGTYLDFNELRVSARSEIEKALEDYVPSDVRKKAAWDLRMALQDVYDQTHGLDLEPLRSRDPDDLGSFVANMKKPEEKPAYPQSVGGPVPALPNTPGGPAAMVFQLAVGKSSLALGPLERRFLGRLGLMPNGARLPNKRKALERQVKPDERLRFAWVAGTCARLFETDFDERHPFARLLVERRSKELEERERAARAAEKLAEELRKKEAIEAARRQRIEDEERRKREKVEQRKAAEAARKKAIEDRKRAAEEKRKAAEAARKKAIEERKRAAEEKRKAAEAARKKAIEERKRAAEARRKAAEAARKKAAEKARAERERAAKARLAKGKGGKGKGGKGGKGKGGGGRKR
ncbi:MAG: hypothetical protein ACKOCB_10550 [Planctomycetia bacterium]